MRSVKIHHREVDNRDYSKFMRRWMATTCDVINDSFIYEKSFNAKGIQVINNRTQRTNHTILRTSFQDSMVIYNEAIEEEIY